MRHTCFAAVLLCASAVSHGQSRADWPQFLGPTGNNLAGEAIAPTAPLSVAWRTPLPAGQSGIVVANGRVFTSGDDDTNEFVIALDAATGTPVWQSNLGAAHATADPQATPAVVGGTLVTISATCVVHGLDVDSGRPLWQRSLVADFKSRFGARGCTMSPLIDGPHVVIGTGAPATGTTVVALEAATGAVAWAATTLPLSLSTPLSAGTFGSERLRLYHHAKPPGTGGLTALRIREGAPEVAWQIDLPGGISDTAALPLPGNKVLLQTWNNSALIDVAASPRIAWTTPDLWALYPPPAHHDGVIYGFGGNSTEFFSAVDVATGQTRWRERIYRGYIVNAGGTLVVLSEAAGLLRLVAPDPERYRELGRLQVFRPGARTTTPPSVAGGRIFVRNAEEIVAIATAR